MKEKEKFNKDYSYTSLETTSEEVLEKLKNGCECNVSCFQDLDPEVVYRHRLNIAELTKNEHDFYLMGIVRAALMNFSERGAKVQRKRSTYTYMGKKVCLYAFLYLENVTIYQLKKIRQHVMVHGVVAIQHGNLHKIPHNAFPLDLYKKVETFLRSYVEKHHSNKSLILNQPLSKVYQEYKEHAKDSDGKHMGYTTFRTFFKKQFPHVRLAYQQTKPQPSNPHSSVGMFEEHIVEVKTEEVINTDDLIIYDEEVLIQHDI